VVGEQRKRCTARNVLEVKEKMRISERRREWKQVVRWVAIEHLLLQGSFDRLSKIKGGGGNSDVLELSSR